MPTYSVKVSEVRSSSSTATSLRERSVTGDTSGQFLLLDTALGNGARFASQHSKWTRYRKSYSDLSTAATTNNIRLCVLPPMTTVESVLINANTAFTGGAISAYTISVGTSADNAKYIQSYDAFSAAAGIASTVPSIESSGWSELRLYATSTGANLSAATAGSVDVWVKTTSTSGSLWDGVTFATDFEETSGNRTDVIGGLTLTDVNTVTSTTGKTGANSAVFTAANAEYFTVPDNASIRIGANEDFTWSVWYYHGGVSAQDQHIIHKAADDDAYSPEYTLRWDTANAKIRFVVGSGLLGAGNRADLSHATVLSTGVWYHIIAWYDATNKQVGIRVNDTETTASWTGATGPTNGQLRIGSARTSDLGVHGYANGRMDRLTFWKRLLSATEREELSAASFQPAHRFPNYLSLVSKTSAYTVTSLDSVILVDATAGAVTVTLPAASVSTGQRLEIKKTDSSGNAVTIDGNGAETIDGAATASLSVQYESKTIVCDGSNWWIL